VAKNTFDTFTKQRARNSYVSVVLSIFTVLFLLGLFFYLVVNARVIATNFQENFTINVLIKPDAQEAEIREFQKQINIDPRVKSVEYITKEEAAEQLKEELDEDFLTFLGYNPLTDVVSLKLHANYVLPDQIALLEKQINTHPIVQKILIDQDLVKLMNDNLERIALFLLVAALVLVLVSISVINSSIRLSIYASRFLIRTMQLVGATQSFIRKPFILRSVLQGLLGGGIAAFIMGGLYQYLTQQYPEMGLLSGWEISLLIGALIMVVGVLISWICTFFAVRKYLKIKTDDLYF